MKTTDLVAKLGIEIPVEEFKVIKSFALDAVPEDAVEPIFPTKFISFTNRLATKSIIYWHTRPNFQKTSCA